MGSDFRAKVRQYRARQQRSTAGMAPAAATEAKQVWAANDADERAKEIKAAADRGTDEQAVEAALADPNKDDEGAGVRPPI